MQPNAGVYVCMYVLYSKLSLFFLFASSTYILQDYHYNTPGRPPPEIHRFLDGI